MSLHIIESISTAARPPPATKLAIIVARNWRLAMQMIIKHFRPMPMPKLGAIATEFIAEPRRRGSAEAISLEC